MTSPYGFLPDPEENLKVSLLQTVSTLTMSRLQAILAEASHVRFGGSILPG